MGASRLALFGSATARAAGPAARWTAGSAAGRAAMALLALLACQPKVQVEAPKEPITINLNVKIEHEIRVEVENDLEELFEEEAGLF